MMQLDPRTTALVLIDLQNGVLGLPLAPRSGPEVVQVSRALAEDATSSFTAEMHGFAVSSILPHISRVTTASGIDLGI
jgi:hypothetical protein